MTDELPFIPLLRSMDASEQQIAGAKIAATCFPFKAPSHYLKQIKSGDNHDPVLQQVLPTEHELIHVKGFCDDPVGDLDAVKSGGIIHKYPNRVLLITTQACAVHCRYCFRRHFPYQDQKLLRSNWYQLINYLQQHTAVTEVILSGGDPLTLSTSQLSELLEQISTVKHITTIRFHTRIPIVQPQRIDSEMTQWLSSLPFKLVMVVHCNHSNEIDNEVATAIQRLATTGLTLLNQSVLLKGINDDAKTLAELSNRLFSVGVLPYYLHLLDKAHGTGHFEVSKQKTIKIVRKLQTLLPGYLLPRVVSEIAGELSKQPFQIPANR
jgi:EF-P beta-lysylation protein EpmB